MISSFNFIIIGDGKIDKIYKIYKNKTNLLFVDLI